jgi:hypothetical protein
MFPTMCLVWLFDCVGHLQTHIGGALASRAKFGQMAHGTNVAHVMAMTVGTGGEHAHTSFAAALVSCSIMRDWNIVIAFSIQVVSCWAGCLDVFKARCLTMPDLRQGL